MLVSAKVVGISAFEKASRLRPFRWVAKNALNRQLKAVKKEIKKAVQDIYTTPHDPDLLASTKLATTNHLEADLEYFYKPHPLADFAVSRHHLYGPVYATYVKIKKASPPKLVKGREGYRYGGFFQKVPYQIFERDQKATWVTPGTRASYSRLYGPSIAEMVASKDVTARLRQKGISRKILVILKEELNKV